jgi:hypothetical protein
MICAHQRMQKPARKPLPPATECITLTWANAGVAANIVALSKLNKLSKWRDLTVTDFMIFSFSLDEYE